MSTITCYNNMNFNCYYECLNRLTAESHEIIHSINVCGIMFLRYGDRNYVPLQAARDYHHSKQQWYLQRIPARRYG